MNFPVKFFVLIALMFVTLAGHAAWAEDYYVELGRAASEAEANAMWADIQPKHKTLAKYSLYPNQILQQDGSTTYRVQAGPMKTKEEAQRVCNRLFRRDVSCFVIEGFDPTKAKSFDAAKDDGKPLALSDFLPWKSSTPVIAEAPHVAEVPAPAEVKNSKAAKVDVAEAIPVPVSEDSNQVTVGEPVAITAVPDAPTIQISDTPSVNPTTGWLSVQPFLDAKTANQFWADVKRKSPDARKYTTQVIHPVVSHDIPKVILAVGTFESELAAMKFCKESIAASSYLECSFSETPPQGDEAKAGEAADEYGMYWVQVLSEKTQDAALEKWEKIRTDNDEILSDVRSQITTSMSKPGVYVVRIGPLKSKSKASQLCDQLKAHKVACSITSL